MDYREEYARRTLNAKKSMTVKILCINTFKIGNPNANANGGGSYSARVGVYMKSNPGVTIDLAGTERRYYSGRKCSSDTVYIVHYLVLPRIDIV